MPRWTSWRSAPGRRWRSALRATRTWCWSTTRSGEDKFVKDGHAKARFDVMYNDFIILGPKADPAKVGTLTAAKDVFKAIATAQANFASRGDKSGTNTKELSIWATAGITPTAEMKWYKSLGQGMGETLLFSQENQAYTLTDRGTYLSMKDKLKDLVIVLGGNNINENKDASLLNPYGVLVVDPAKHPGVNFELATQVPNLAAVGRNAEEDRRLRRGQVRPAVVLS